MRHLLVCYVQENNTLPTRAAAAPRQGCGYSGLTPKVPASPARNRYRAVSCWTANWSSCRATIPRAGYSRLGNGSGSAKLELVFPGGTYGIRKRLISAELIPLAEAPPVLLGVDPGEQAGRPMRRSVRVWAAAAAAGVGLVARGRLLPTVGADGADVWRAGPLDPADLGWLRELAAAFPPTAHALAVPGSRPMRLRSPEALIRDLWDAIADLIARSPPRPGQPRRLRSPTRSRRSRRPRRVARRHHRRPRGRSPPRPADRGVPNGRAGRCPMRRKGLMGLKGLTAGRRGSGWCCSCAAMPIRALSSTPPRCGASRRRARQVRPAGGDRSAAGAAARRAGLAAPRRGIAAGQPVGCRPGRRRPRQPARPGAEELAGAGIQVLWPSSLLGAGL